MVHPSKVVRDENNRATMVVMDFGNVQFTYILDRKGCLTKIGSSSQSQVLDDQTLVVSPVDLEKARDMANAILHEKRRKAQ